MFDFCVFNFVETLVICVLKRKTNRMSRFSFLYLVQNLILHSHDPVQSWLPMTLPAPIPNPANIGCFRNRGYFQFDFQKPDLPAFSSIFRVRFSAYLSHPWSVTFETLHQVILVSGISLVSFGFISSSPSLHNLDHSLPNNFDSLLSFWSASASSLGVKTPFEIMFIPNFSMNSNHFCFNL